MLLTKGQLGKKSSNVTFGIRNGVPTSRTNSVRRAAQPKEFLNLEWALAEAEAAGYWGMDMGTGTGHG
jgi:hypothetical protein